jgi:hypothetical protein
MFLSRHDASPSSSTAARLATRYVLVAVGALSLLLGPSVGASASSKRVERQPYTLGPLAVYFPFGGLGYTCSGGCLHAVAQPNEHHLRIEMRDATGVPVYGSVYIAGHPNTGLANGRPYWPLCGSRVFDVSEGDDVRVEAPVGIQPLLPCAEATSGTIVATFSG